jgi:hypothetical protein
MIIIIRLLLVFLFSFFFFFLISWNLFEQIKPIFHYIILISVGVYIEKKRNFTVLTLLRARTGVGCGAKDRTRNDRVYKEHLFFYLCCNEIPERVRRTNRLYYRFQILNVRSSALTVQFFFQLDLLYVQIWLVK